MSRSPRRRSWHPTTNPRWNGSSNIRWSEVAQDTTELDYTGKNDIEGLGPLNYENRRGLYLHATLAITPERLSLGQLDSWSWTRPFEDADKESIRWIEGYRRTSETQQQLHQAGAPTRVVYMADREGDIHELFAERERIVQGGEIAADWLIRSKAISVK